MKSIAEANYEQFMVHFMVHYILKVMFNRLKDDRVEEDLMRGGSEFQSEIMDEQKQQLCS